MKMTDAHKKFIDKIALEKMEAKKSIKRLKLEKKIFYQLINALIESNDAEAMIEYIDYMTGKLRLSSNQFVHRKIYELKNKEVKPTKIFIDYEQLNNKIEQFKKEEEKFLKQ